MTEDKDIIDSDLKEVYSASQTEQPSTELDTSILSAARQEASKRKQTNKSRMAFDPPIAIAATLLITVGLVTLVQHSGEQTLTPPSLMTEPSEEIAISDEDSTQELPAPGKVHPPIKDQAPAPAMLAKEAPANISESESADSPEPVTVAPQSNVQLLGQIQTPPLSDVIESDAQLSQRMEIEKHRQITEAQSRMKVAEERKQQLAEKHKREQIAEAMMSRPKSAEKKRMVITHDKPEAGLGSSQLADDEAEINFYKLLPQQSEEKADSVAAFAPVQRVIPDKGETRNITGKIEVWYDENHRWVAPERFFELELKRLNGPTFGRTHTYPEYETTEEWQTLIEILPNGQECPMVFFHERWRRLADVLDLDESLRNYGGCSDVLKTSTE